MILRGLSSSLLLAVGLAATSAGAVPARGDFQLVPLGVDFLTRGGLVENGDVQVRFSGGFAWTAEDVPVGLHLGTAMQATEITGGDVVYSAVAGAHVDVLRMAGSGLRLRAAAGPTLSWTRDVKVGVEGDVGVDVFFCVFRGFLIGVSYGFVHLPTGWLERSAVQVGVTW